MRRPSIVPVAWAWLAASAAAQRTLHVPGEFSEIRLAIDAADSGDTVLVAPGTYAETFTFQGKKITVRSEAGALATIVDASSFGEGPVVGFFSGEGRDSVLEGFTITGGRASTLVQPGGGIGCVDIEFDGRIARPTIRACRIVGNTSAFLPGGGIFGDPLLEDCLIANNRTIEQDGGGIYGTPTMRRCEVRDNEGYSGGGIFVAGSGARFEDVLFVGNTTRDGVTGGGAYVLGPGASFERCLFAGNRISGAFMYRVQGAALFAAVPARLERCTVVDNEVAAGFPPGESSGGLLGPVSLVDCIVRGNDERQIGDDPHATARYSNVEGGFPGTGNVDVDPRFVDRAGGDYRLAPDSPCIDAGDPAGALDPDRTRADLGAFPFAQPYAFVLGGSGVNPPCLRARTAPELGATWSLEVHAAVPAVRFAALVVVDRAIDVPLVVPAGELLIDPARPRLARLLRGTAGPVETFDLAVPPDASLAGFVVHAQALSGGDGARLCNAITAGLGLSPSSSAAPFVRRQ